MGQAASENKKPSRHGSTLPIDAANNEIGRGVGPRPAESLIPLALSLPVVFGLSSDTIPELVKKERPRILGLSAGTGI